ncbi:amino acid ABC transporter permease [Suttonella sp. R2A3]|uniref:amino acid ABC transporter permease n=1 Tax=Suttonella sp. R2A3 TaxID=2908648 RepID=UPI001F3D4782|nr:amino acid ABC transporter permease [Suttonella sp. R2A3]UJF25058.1 amino acid ABC transporter permease [Suttonella sp. R2A3]
MNEEHVEYLPNRKPPAIDRGIIAWLRHNLFSSWLNTALTLISLYALYRIMPPLLDWVLFSANFRGESREACDSGGACWVFIANRWQQLMYGFYPTDARWRVNVVFLVLLPLAVLAIVLSKGNKRFYAIVATMVLMPIVSWTLLKGGTLGLKTVPTSLWGGMMLTLVVSSAGILFSLPLGILLALGRRSRLPVIHWLCTAFIELWRGVPLITVLFMASSMLPLFLPGGLYVDNLVRALIGVALFASAYMAEVVRGGLAAIDRGQYEASDSIGLSYVAKMRLIILPQALRTVIPGITNTYVGLLKDTTLVSIIGLYDFLGIVHSASQDPEWLGYGIEGYAFTALVYFLICYGMSQTSYTLERYFSPERRK